MRSHSYSLGLVGFPLEHSISPKLHNTALDALKLKGEYKLYEVEPLPMGKRKLDQLLNKFRGEFINGLNVTIPHKQSVLNYLDELTERARTIGAVNTIFRENDGLVGENTDALGFLCDLERVMGKMQYTQNSFVGSDHKHALILGAGGSARAVVFALLRSGWNVAVAARRYEQALEIVNTFQTISHDQRIAVLSLTKQAIEKILQKIVLIVNTTPLGMWPDVDRSPWPENLAFPRDAFVYDLVYNPRETKLVTMARASGLPAVTGTGMLVEQAALAFELWTGRVPPRDLMRQAAFE